MFQRKVELRNLTMMRTFKFRLMKEEITKEKKKDSQAKDLASTNLTESQELAEELISPRVAMARVTLGNPLKMI